MSNIVYRNQSNKIEINDFIDIDLNKTYEGTTLTDLTIVAAIYEDGGEQTEWNVISDNLSYSSSTKWDLNLSKEQSTQEKSYGTIFITSSNIQPYQLDIVFSDIVSRAKHSIGLRNIGGKLNGEENPDAWKYYSPWGIGNTSNNDNKWF